MALAPAAAPLSGLCYEAPFLLIAFGLILGIPLSLATSRVLTSQLYGLNPFDPILLATAVLLFGLFALIATLAPALRASACLTIASAGAPE